MILALVGCTFSPGQAFTTLGQGSLSSGFAPGARDLGDGTAVTDLGATYRLDRFELELAGVEIQELRGAEGVEFDPADPPAGYTLCHGGHCHAADGSLVDTSQILAELAGEGAELVAVTRWERDDRLDLLDGASLDLGPPDAPELPEVTLTRAVISLARARLDGEIADGELRIPFSLELPAAEASADLGLVVDQNAPAGVRLSLDWTVDGTLFDGIDLASLADPDALIGPVRDNLLLNPLDARLLEVP